ncbi:hypothetical protein CEXT_600161 [Caerostris extrusa]|uniref:Uncharacterized protein n=1 Tax=Caerostris extrusa TaxID=172846 RepID=A0AAV4Q3U7_CAEEX|nr:hypothetical protein CEXT_600161 [Caerostris extrusa]
MHVGRQPNSGFRLDRIIQSTPTPFAPLRPSPSMPTPTSTPYAITITTSNVQLFLPYSFSLLFSTARPNYSTNSPTPPFSIPLGRKGRSRRRYHVMSLLARSQTHPFPPTPLAGARPPFNKPSFLFPL